MYRTGVVASRCSPRTYEYTIFSQPTRRVEYCIHYTNVPYTRLGGGQDQVEETGSIKRQDASPVPRPRGWWRGSGGGAPLPSPVDVECCLLTLLTGARGRRMVLDDTPPPATHDNHSYNHRLSLPQIMTHNPKGLSKGHDTKNLLASASSR